MGNSESSSQFPPVPSNNNDGNNNGKTSSLDQAKTASTKDDDDEGSTSSALKIGAVVAGIALLAFIDYSLAGIVLLAFGAYSLISSASKIGAVVVGIALLAFSDYYLVGTALLAFGAYYSLASSVSSQSKMEILESEAGSSRSCQNLYRDNYLSYTRESGPAGGTNEHSAFSYKFSALGMIKIMSYNVWSLEVEKFQIDKRMESIGQLIQEHTPDIIFLQEVTHRIYGIFKSCDWWQLYNCSDPPEKATIKQFCMQLSKLPVKKFSCVSFGNSTTGRGLCVAEISAGAKRKLIVATCHLRRPDEAHSEERVSQVKHALSFLNTFPNVGGDMNWNKNSDGQFPLFGEWQDAWSVLRPDEDGYTYDTKSNPMLKHTGSRKGRLDRFICKLEDFKMKNIEMIGTNAMFHNGKRLPILPSDHYGLILTICPK